MNKEGRLQFWRLLKIDEMIREHRHPTVASLAKEFEVSIRTVERDIEFLRDRYQAPIKYDSAKHGYTYTQDTFFLRSLFLTSEEFFAVAVFEKALKQYRGTPIEEKLKVVFAKLAELLPSDAVSIDTMWINDSLTFITEPSPELSFEIFQIVFEGVKTHNAIQFYYRGLEEVDKTLRRCEPHHIVCQRGVWYVIGLCLDKNEERIFSFARMQNAKVLQDHKFEPLKNFNVENYIDKNIGVWLTKREPFLVRLLFSPSIAVFAQERVWSSEQSVSLHKDGSVEVSFKTTQFEEMKRFVLGQGATVRVLAPDELILAVKKEIDKMKKMYLEEEGEYEV